MKKTTLTINRNNTYFDRLRNYKIILDSKYIGSIYSNEKKSFEVSEGKHTLYVKIDWCRSKKIDFEVSNNDIEFECGNSIKDFWHGLLVMVYITIFKNNYLWLKKLT